MFIFLNFVAVNGPRVHKFSLCKAREEESWNLEFNGDSYEFYFFNSNSNETVIIEKGTCLKTRNKLEFQREKHKTSNEDLIPRVLYYSRMSKQDFENLDSKPFAYGIKDYILWKRYHVLSEFL